MESRLAEQLKKLYSTELEKIVQDDDFFYVVTRPKNRAMTIKQPLGGYISHVNTRGELVIYMYCKNKHEHVFTVLRSNFHPKDVRSDYMQCVEFEQMKELKRTLGLH